MYLRQTEIMQHASRMPSQLCRAGKAEIMQSNGIVLTQTHGLRNSHLKRTPGIEDRAQRTTLGLPIRSVIL